MKRFVFTLQKILDLRTFEQKQVEMRLGKAVAEETKIQAALDLVAQKRAATVIQSDQLKTLVSLYEVNLYFAFLDQQKEKLIVELAQAHAVTEETRSEMRMAMQKCKVLEQLKDKRLVLWKKNALLAEEIQNDDIITARFRQ